MRQCDLAKYLTLYITFSKLLTAISAIKRFRSSTYKLSHTFSKPLEAPYTIKTASTDHVPNWFGTTQMYYNKLSNIKFHVKHLTHTHLILWYEIRPCSCIYRAIWFPGTLNNALRMCQRNHIIFAMRIKCLHPRT